MINATLVWVLTYLWYGIDQSLRMMTPQMDRQVKIPMNKVAFLESFGLVLATRINLEDEVEVEHRTSPDKINRYVYENISILLRNNDRPYIPFK